MTRVKHITVLKSLDGQGEAAEKWFEPHGCLQSVVDSPAPGFIRLVMLGAEGLQIRHHEHLVTIPLALLLRLSEQVQPALRPPTNNEIAADMAANSQLLPAQK